MAFTTLPSAGARLYASTLTALINELRPVFARKTADETVNNSAALQDDDELQVAVEANAVYNFDLHIVSNSGVTPDLKIAWVVPSSTTMSWSGIYVDTTGALLVNSQFTQATTLALGGIAADVSFHFWGVVLTSSTAGTLKLQWAQNTANASNSIIRAGSALLLTRTS